MQSCNQPHVTLPHMQLKCDVQTEDPLWAVCGAHPLLLYVADNHMTIQTLSSTLCRPPPCSPYCSHYTIHTATTRYMQPQHYIQPLHYIYSHYTIYAATTLYMQPLHRKLHDCCCSMLLATDMLLRRQEWTHCCICDCSSDPAVLAWDSGSTSISISLYRWTSVGRSAGLSPAASAASCCAACQGSEFAIWATSSACMCKAGSL